MNCVRPIFRRHLVLRSSHRPTPQPQPTSPLESRLRRFGSTPAPAAMEAGTRVPGLEDLYPEEKDPSKSRAPTVRPRAEYPAWVGGLVQPLPSLAKLRNMRIEDASDQESKRYLKLVRRAKIKENNMTRAK